MRKTYFLVDSENVRLERLELLSEEQLHVRVFLGENLKNLPRKQSVAIQQMGARAQYIEISGQGPNALDFHIAYYIGRLAVQEPEAAFHILSRDTGFDPLVRHLRKAGLHAYRSASLAEIPMLKALHAKTPAQIKEAAIAKLRQMRDQRPGAEKTLASTLSLLFAKRLSEKLIKDLIETLKADGAIAIFEAKVTYPEKFWGVEVPPGAA